MNGYRSGSRVDMLLGISFGGAWVLFLFFTALACRSKPMVTERSPIRQGPDMESGTRIYEARPGATAAVMSSTFRSPGPPAAPMDTDGDGDIDLDDYAVLINDFTGPR